VRTGGDGRALVAESTTCAEEYPTRVMRREIIVVGFLSASCPGRAEALGMGGGKRRNLRAV